MAVTIKDVAALAGVSTSTVSRVCNNNPAISRETADRVRRAMAELGYEPNTSSESAPPQPIKMIGIVLPPSDKDAFENNFFLKAIRGISQVCNQRQTASTIITGEDYPELLHSVKTLHLSGRIDGFILLYSRKNDVINDYLCEQGIPYVIVGKPQDGSGTTLCIDNDNLLAGRDAADYLYSLGHRRIVCLRPGGKKCHEAFCKGRLLCGIGACSCSSFAFLFSGFVSISVTIHLKSLSISACLQVLSGSS